LKIAEHKVKPQQERRGGQPLAAKALIRARWKPAVYLASPSRGFSELISSAILPFPFFREFNEPLTA